MKRAVFGLAFMTALSGARPALGGEGPWTLQPGEHNLYFGALSYRYGAYDTGASVSQLPTEVIGTELMGVWSYGLFEGLELEVRVPYEAVRVGDPRAALCRDSPRRRWCAPTRGVGDMTLLVKTRLLDEVYAAPVTVSGVWGVRTGETYSATRGRLTTLGTGQTDFGGALSIGRADVLGKGWYRASGSLGYWYRVPHVTEPDKVPADEFQFDVGGAVAPFPAWSVGPARKH